MRPSQLILCLGAAAALLLASNATAGTAKAGVSGEAPIPGPSVTMTQAGFATAEASFKNGFAQANAYEFKAGIGASAFAAATGSLSRTTAASASAAMTDRFRVNDVDFLDNVSDTVFLLNFAIRADGTTESSSTPFPGDPSFHSQVASQFDYSWNVNGVTGSGHHQHDKLFRGGRVDQDFDSFKGGVLLVSVGDFVNLSFNASVLAGAFSLPGAGGDAATDFSHTLAWNGITGVTAMSKSTGASIDLPTGFRLSLMSDDGTFDYWNAAGPNPFVTPVGGGAVPEPATWAVMLLGFGGLGMALRSRRRSAALA